MILRLAGKNDKAVRQLELTYGGGKTHTLITLYHLVNEPYTPARSARCAGIYPAYRYDAAQAAWLPCAFDKLDVEKGMEVRAPTAKLAGSSSPGASWLTRSPAPMACACCMPRG